ncbi:sugar phosphate isomerase/epimerase [Dactylosporangium vinaceum]|nr:sugar phosphate isomerase/epimerase [Dactylosporangium vinaceum]
MKLAFSTLGCSGMPLAEVAAMAARTGWSGLELRSAPDEPIHTGTPWADRVAARADLGAAAPVCVASYVRVAAGSDDGDVVAALLAEAGLAADLGAGAVRVFAGAGGPDGPVDGDPDAAQPAARRLRAAADSLPGDVELWLETHDSHASGAAVARVLDLVGHPRVRAVWDIAHPWGRGEPIPVTARLLAPHLAHVQIKDQRSAADRTPVRLGTGVLPLTAMFDALGGLGYRGWLSLEWERKWHPSAEPLEAVLVAGREYLQSRLLPHR